MRRRFWLILTMAILFGIEAPLCAFACLDAGTPQVATLDSSSESASNPGPHHQPQGSQAPCHGSKSGSAPTDSSGVPESHQDCGCDFAVEGLLSDSPNTATSFVMAWTQAGAVVDLVAAGDREAWTAAFGSDIPPPDILLLKSTLLI